MFQRILVCTDLTDGLQRLARFVPSLSVGGIQSITFLHVVPVPENQVPKPDEAKMQRVRDRLQSSIGTPPDGIEINLDVTCGRATDTILAAVKQYNSELLMMGMPSRSVLNEKLFGSTTMAVCQRISIPVLTFRPQLVASLTDEELDLRCRHLFQQLLLPYDGSEAGKYLVQQIQQSFAEVDTSSLKHCYLSVVTGDLRRNESLQEGKVQAAEQLLEPVKALFASNGLQVSTEVRQGDPVVQVLEAAQEQGVSAIALASDSLGKLREWSAPSFAGEILRRSWHPVLFFPMSR